MPRSFSTGTLTKKGLPAPSIAGDFLKLIICLTTQRDTIPRMVLITLYQAVGDCHQRVTGIIEDLDIVKRL